MLEVRQRQRWRSEGIGIQRLRVDTAVSALDEASGLMKPEPEVRTSFHPDRRSPDDSRISGLRHARTAVPCSFGSHVSAESRCVHRLLTAYYSPLTPSAAWKASSASPGVS